MSVIPYPLPPNNNAHDVSSFDLLSGLDCEAHHPRDTDTDYLCTFFGASQVMPVLTEVYRRFLERADGREVVLLADRFVLAFPRTGNPV